MLLAQMDQMTYTIVVLITVTLASVALTARVTRIQLSEWASSLTEALPLTNPEHSVDLHQVKCRESAKGFGLSFAHLKY